MSMRGLGDELSGYMHRVRVVRIRLDVYPLNWLPLVTTLQYPGLLLPIQSHVGLWSKLAPGVHLSLNWSYLKTDKHNIIEELLGQFFYPVVIATKSNIGLFLIKFIASLPLSFSVFQFQCYFFPVWVPVRLRLHASSCRSALRGSSSWKNHGKPLSATLSTVFWLG